jgi:hypothetical protein
MGPVNLKVRYDESHGGAVKAARPREHRTDVY